MTAKPSCTPAVAPALALALATLPAQAAPAQAAPAQAHPEPQTARLAVEDRVLKERIHQDLSEVLWGAAPNYGLDPESIRFAFPDSSYLTTAAALVAGAGGVYAIGVPLAMVIGGAAGGVLAAAFWHGDAEEPPPDVDFRVETVVFLNDPTPKKVVDFGFGEVRGYALDGYSFIEGYLKDRVEVHYRLKGLHGRSEGGSCLAFFALEEAPDGSRDLRYELDACSHDRLFPQEVPTEDGDLRIGPDGVDVWDKILGQDMVVAKGSIPVL